MNPLTPHDELELLSAYLDGELASEERARLDGHLPTCAECRTTLDALRATVVDLRALPEPSPTPQDSWALRAAIRRARTPVRRWQRAAVAAASVAAVAIAVLAFALPDRNDTGSLAKDAELAAGGVVPIFTVDGNLDNVAAYGRLVQEAGLLGDRTLEAGGQAAPTVPARSGTGGFGVVTSQPLAATAYAGTDATAEQATRAAIERCVQTIRSSTQELLQAKKYELATFEKAPAFLLFFQTTERIELWVTARADCRVLFFAQAG